MPSHGAREAARDYMARDARGAHMAYIYRFEAMLMHQYFLREYS
jgi:hypothetical protein